MGDYMVSYHELHSQNTAKQRNHGTTTYLCMGIVIRVQRREECMGASRYIIPFKLCAVKTDLNVR